MAIDLPRLATGEVGITASVRTERATASHHFSNVYEQALNTPPFSPWPAPPTTAPVQTRTITSQSTQPMERSRQRDGRQRRG